jgi:hypothetical protein
MRVWHLTFMAGIGLALAGCGSATTPASRSPGETPPKVGLGDEAAVLRGKMLGKWTGTDTGKPVSYEFDKDDTYKYESDKLKYTGGTWKAVDDKNVELTYTLTDEQLAVAKEVWKVTMELIDKGPIIPGIQVEKPPEPKKENTIKVNAAVTGDELTLGTQRLKKAK